MRKEAKEDRSKRRVGVVTRYWGGYMLEAASGNAVRT